MFDPKQFKKQVGKTHVWTDPEELLLLRNKENAKKKWPSQKPKSVWPPVYGTWVDNPAKYGIGSITSMCGLISWSEGNLYSGSNHTGMASSSTVDRDNLPK